MIKCEIHCGNRISPTTIKKEKVLSNGKIKTVEETVWICPICRCKMWYDEDGIFFRQKGNNAQLCPKCGSNTPEYHAKCYYCYDCGHTFPKLVMGGKNDT